jgi:hypothetical protein
MTTLRIENFETLADIEQQINEYSICYPGRISELTMTAECFDKIKFICSTLAGRNLGRNEDKTARLFGFPIRVINSVMTFTLEIPVDDGVYWGLPLDWLLCHCVPEALMLCDGDWLSPIGTRIDPAEWLWGDEIRWAGKFMEGK